MRLDKESTDVILAAPDQNFIVRKARDDLVILDPRNNTHVALYILDSPGDCGMDGPQSTYG